MECHNLEYDDGAQLEYNDMQQSRTQTHRTFQNTIMSHNWNMMTLHDLEY